MHLLGFRYDARRKSFFVKGHERDDVVANRTLFCNNYLTKLEPYFNRWMHISIAEAMAIEDLDIGFRRSYVDVIGNEELIEFQVDYGSHQRRGCFDGNTTGYCQSNNQHTSVFQRKANHDCRARRERICTKLVGSKNLDRSERSETTTS